MSALPTLGGTNAGWGAMNNRGQVSGYAENSHMDPACPGKVAVNGTGPQLFDFEPVIWGPKPGQIRQLSLLPGDTVGMALGINDNGQAVGTSGTCANTIVPGLAAGPHAVLWESNGSVHDLGNLGGTVNTGSLGAGTVAFAINNRDMVAGQSDLPGDNAFHPFLWTRETGMMDLGVLPGDLVGAGLNMNNRGEIVGASVSAPGPASGNPRAFLWREGAMADLNDLIPADAPLYLLTAFGINDEGDIIGFGVTGEGDVHGFLATPSTEGGGGKGDAVGSKDRVKPVLSDDARKIMLQQPGRRGR
jgi:probable HAF family extracellular repeat protein